jgi:hypothetical protein
MCRIRASKFVGNEPAWLTDLAFDETAKKTFSRTLIAVALHQNVNHIAVLVHGTQEIVAFPLNGDKYFVDVLHVAYTALALFEFSRIIFRYHCRMVSEATVMARSTRSSSTSQKLRQNRWESQTA